MLDPPALSVLVIDRTGMSSTSSVSVALIAVPPDGVTEATFEIVDPAVAVGLTVPVIV